MYIHKLIVIIWLLCMYHMGSSYPCIPVMGFAFLRDPMHFSRRLITSIDFCIHNLVIIYPKSFIYDHNAEFMLFHESISHVMNHYVKNITLLPQKHNLIGCAEGWNLIISSFPLAPWYLISAYDVEFLPGQLEEFSRRFWRESGMMLSETRGEHIVKTNFAHTKWQNLPGGKGFNLFGISREVIDNCGYFDENIFPAFWEDRDYQYRMSLWPGARISTFRTIKPWHGEHADIVPILNSTTGTKKFNYTSGTVYLGNRWREAMQQAAAWNLEYVVKKWGCNLSYAKAKHHLIDCKYVTPFNQPYAPLSYWKLNSERIKRIRRIYDS